MVPSWIIPIPQVMQQHLGSQAQKPEPARPPRPVVVPPRTDEPDAGTRARQRAPNRGAARSPYLSSMRTPARTDLSRSRR